MKVHNINMDVLLIVLIVLGCLLVSYYAIQQYFYYILRKQRKLSWQKRKSLKQRRVSLSFSPLFEIPRRKSSVTFRFREISRTNTIPENEIYEPEDKTEATENAFYEMDDSNKYPEKSNDPTSLPTLNKEALNRTESFGRGRISSESTSEISEDGSYRQISFSIGPDIFPETEDGDTMVYRKGSLPYPVEYYPCHFHRRMSSPGVDSCSRCVKTGCLIRKHSLQNPIMLNSVTKTFHPGELKVLGHHLRRTSELPLAVRRASVDNFDVPIYTTNEEMMYKHWSDRRLLDSGIFATDCEGATVFDIPVVNARSAPKENNKM